MTLLEKQLLTIDEMSFIGGPSVSRETLRQLLKAAWIDGALSVMESITIEQKGIPEVLNEIKEARQNIKGGN